MRTEAGAECECDRMAEEKRQSPGIKIGTVIQSPIGTDTTRTPERTGAAARHVC